MHLKKKEIKKERNVLRVLDALVKKKNLKLNMHLFVVMKHTNVNSKERICYQAETLQEDKENELSKKKQDLPINEMSEKKNAHIWHPF